MYSSTLVCFKIIYFITLKFLNSKIPIDVFGICEKNQGGANFIVCPRAQNCLATPLVYDLLRLIVPQKLI